MMEVSQRAAVGGPTFVRLLARLADADVPPPRQSLADRLSQWIDWNHAVALSGALDRRPATDPLDAPGADAGDADDCARVRALLTQAIVGDRAFASLEPDAVAETGAGQVPDHAFFRQRHIALQQTMEAYVGRLRGRLRDRLAQTSADLGRLAAVDAVMERALGRREQALLSAAPAVLGAHFERLRQAAVAADTPSPSSAWLDLFLRDMRSVLLAELDVRLQPAEGLLAALDPRRAA